MLTGRHRFPVADPRMGVSSDDTASPEGNSGTQTDTTNYQRSATMRVFTTVPRRWRQIGKAHDEFFGAIRPATALIGVRGFIDPKWLVEIEASAFRMDE